MIVGFSKRGKKTIHGTLHTQNTTTPHNFLLQTQKKKIPSKGRDPAAPPALGKLELTTSRKKTRKPSTKKNPSLKSLPRLSQPLTIIPRPPLPSRRALLLPMLRLRLRPIGGITPKRIRTTTLQTITALVRPSILPRPGTPVRRRRQDATAAVLRIRMPIKGGATVSWRPIGRYERRTRIDRRLLIAVLVLLVQAAPRTRRARGQRHAGGIGGGGVAAFREGGRGHGVLVAVEVAQLVAEARVAARRGAEGVELGGELGLGFYKRAAVVAHGLVARVRVLADDGVDAGEEDHEEQDEGAGCVVDEEDDAHDAGDEALVGEDVRLI